MIPDCRCGYVCAVAKAAPIRLPIPLPLSVPANAQIFLTSKINFRCRYQLLSIKTVRLQSPPATVFTTCKGSQPNQLLYLTALIFNQLKTPAMNKSIVSLTGWALLIAALGFYLYGIGKALQLTFSALPITAGDYSPVLESLIASVQALLLTNLGVLLGISVTAPTSAVAQKMLLGRAAQGVQVQSLELPDPLTMREKIQLFALALYILSLVACVVAWAVNNFSDDQAKVVPLVSASGKMFFGVVLAYLTMVLSSKP